jgi:hypothetical protein
MSGDVDRRTAISVAVALVAVIAIIVVGIAVAGGGGDDGESSTSPAPAEAPGGGVTPPSAGGLQLPPGIAECLADQGVDIPEGADLNELLHGGAVPPQVLNACFQALHQGGGVP